MTKQMQHHVTNLMQDYLDECPYADADELFEFAAGVLYDPCIHDARFLKDVRRIAGKVDYRI